MPASERTANDVYTLEIIGKVSGVSKSLIYNYFSNLSDLLRELVQRELQRLQVAAASTATTFEELVRSITHEYVK